MVAILKSFEQVAVRFSPMVLIVPGLAMTALGLLAWLAGMCLRRLVSALVGAAVGLAAGFFVGRPNSPMAVLVAGSGAVLGAVLPRLLLAMLLASLGFVTAFGVVARAHPVERQGTLLGAPEAGDTADRLTVSQSLDAVRAFGFDVADWVEAIARRLLPVEWAVIAAIGVGLLVLGLFFGQAAGALTCSMLGTAFVFAGLATLVIFKGSAPIAYVERQGPFYGIVFLGMAAFGTLEQLLLCRPAHGGRRDPVGRDHSRQEESKRGWRNR